MKRSKFRNIKTNGFDSRREAKRAEVLQFMEKIGAISNLQYQIPVELIPKQGKIRATTWIMDFMYNEDGEEIWEDCKGFRTEVYKIKKKLVKWVHGKDIRET